MGSIKQIFSTEITGSKSSAAIRRIRHSVGAGAGGAGTGSSAGTGSCNFQLLNGSIPSWCPIAPTPSYTQLTTKIPVAFQTKLIPSIERTLVTTKCMYLPSAVKQSNFSWTVESSLHPVWLYKVWAVFIIIIIIIIIISIPIVMALLRCPAQKNGGL